MALSVEKIVIPNEDTEVEVHLWVGREHEVEIGIETDGKDTFDLYVADEIAKAIQSLVGWSSTPHGMKKINEAVQKEKAAYENHDGRPKKKRSRR